MTQRSLDLPDEVRSRIALHGDQGAAWERSLGELLSLLERDWRLVIGRTLRGGSGSAVWEATSVDERAAVLKIPMHWLDPPRHEWRVLRAANGRGYARLLQHDDAGGAMLIERLGPPLSLLGLDVDAQIEPLCATLLEAWDVPVDGSDLPSGDRKADELATFIERTWLDQGPCSERTIQTALAFAAERRAAFDPRSTVVAYGEAHADNLLLASAGGALRRFKFIDPEGFSSSAPTTSASPCGNGAQRFYKATRSPSASSAAAS